MKKIIIFTICALTFAGCGKSGGNSNPLKGHAVQEKSIPLDSNLSNPDAIPTRTVIQPPPPPEKIYQKQTETVYITERQQQNFMAAQLFTIAQETDLRFLTSVEPDPVKKLNSKNVTVKLLLNGQAKFDLEKDSSLPDDLKIVLVSRDKNTANYQIQWKPSGNLIPDDETSWTDKLKVNLNIRDIKFDDVKDEEPILEAMRAVGCKGNTRQIICPKNLEATVSRDPNPPRIVNLEGLPKVINEGSEPATFTAVVFAPNSRPRGNGALKPIIPVVDILEASGVRGNLLNPSGSRFISIDPNHQEAEYDASTGLWRVFFVLDTTREPAPKQYMFDLKENKRKPVPDARSIVLEFKLLVRPIFGRAAVPFTDRFEVIYAQPETTASAMPPAESTP